MTSLLKGAAHLKISFIDIEIATNNFETIIGKGGFGVVYKGELSISGELTTVAVKRLTLLDNPSGQGLKEFLTEVQLLPRCKHPNIIRLVGFCDEGNEKILVYEYAERGSLDKYLCSAAKYHLLTWEQRIKICIEAARGLDYLHNHVSENQRVIHRDIKSSNIVLDNNGKAMITDFGLSRIGRRAYDDSNFSFNESDTYLITNACGTMGYCDPAYVTSRILTKESDVYSFGVVLFKVLCGRLCYITVDIIKERSLPRLVKRYYNKGKLNKIIDPELKDVLDSDSVKTFSDIAYLCLSDERELRPSMKLVVQKLREAFELLEPREALEYHEFHERLVLKSSHLTNRCQRFSLLQIAKATNEFGYRDFLGNGAFGKVYIGNICGKEVAVKRMSMDPIQGVPAFEKEVELLSACNQVNVISLVGYCDEGAERILVYEFMPNGSLYDYLFHNQRHTPTLTVEQRLEICLGVAKGLSYLHSGGDFNIIHCDLKADNILLDPNLVPKISDFGLSRTRAAGASSSQQVTNHIQGTEGYLAPECYEPNYKVSRKADVYAFGVVILEVLCERPAWK